MGLTFPITPTWIDRGGVNFPSAYYSAPKGGFQNIVSIGSSLFACLQPQLNAASANLQMYRSDNGGNSWQMPTSAGTLHPRIGGGAGGRVFAFNGLVYVANFVSGDASTTQIASYDPVSDSWGSPTACYMSSASTFPSGGGFKLWAGFRPNGDCLTVYKNDAGGLLSTGVSLNGSEIGSFSGSPGAGWRFPYYVSMDTDGTLHIILIGSDDTGSGWDIQKLWHVSVSTGNTFSLEQYLDNVEINFYGPPDTRPCFSMEQSGTNLGFAYPFQIETWNGGGGSPAIKAAIGDMISDPLNPIWVEEVVCTDTAKMPNSNAPGQMVRCMWNGSGQLEAYWTSPSPDAISNSINNQIWMSTRTAPNTWSAAVLVYQTPAEDPASGYGPPFGFPYYPLQGFDLLSVAGTTRVMLDITEGDFVSPYYFGVGYTAAGAARRNGFSKAGGPGASRGSYASA